MEDSHVAAALSAQLAERIGPERFETWFSTQANLRIEDATRLVVGASSTFVRDWLQARFGDDLRDSWQAIAGEAGSVVFEIGSRGGEQILDAAATTTTPSIATAEPANANGKSISLRQRILGETATPMAGLKNISKQAARESAGQRNEFAMSNFVVGPTNEYAFRSAELTAYGRQQASPLLFCGPPGVGKTHLLRAVVREYRQRHPRASAVYLSAEQFTIGFLDALRGSGMPSFRHKCRGAQLLAIDDLQFFPGKRRTIEELLHTIDSMVADGRQLVLASDRGLSDLRALGPELVSRLAGGLTCEIEHPDFATRVGILRRMRDAAHLAIDDDVLALVAQQITNGARELRGAMNRLEAMSHAYQEPITRSLAVRSLSELARHNERPVKLADVEKAVCQVFGVEPAQLRSQRKGRTVAEPRMLAMWLARKYTRVPWSEIGEFFGRRSHSTVISAHRRVQKLITDRAQIELADRACNVEDAIRKLESALRTG